MKYILDIEDDLFAELKDIAQKLSTDVGTVIVASIKSNIISFDIFDGIVSKTIPKGK